MYLWWIHDYNQYMIKKEMKKQILYEGIQHAMLTVK